MKITKEMKAVGMLFLFLAFFTLVGCDEDVSSTIPYSQVSLTLDLNGKDKDLNGTLSYKEYTSRTLESDRLGYGGILVVNGIGENDINLYAYDLSCPNEAQSNIKIKPKTTGLTATCPQCKAVYNIANGGFPESGSKYWLRQYLVLPIQGSETRYKVSN